MALILFESAVSGSFIDSVRRFTASREPLVSAAETLVAKVALRV